MVKKCLLEADALGCRSIAFPAFGTGKLDYPVRDSALAMFEAAEEYQFEAIGSTLERVLFAVYGTDKDLAVKVAVRNITDLEDIT